MKEKIVVTENFKEWVIEITKDYRRAQIKASIRVNSELLLFYFNLGKDIYDSSFKKTYGDAFYDVLSKELTSITKDSKGFSPRSLRYMERFYILYKDESKILPQLVAQ